MIPTDREARNVLKAPVILNEAIPCIRESAVKELLESTLVVKQRIFGKNSACSWGILRSFATQATLTPQDDKGPFILAGATVVADARSGHCISYCLNGNIRPEGG